MTRYEKMVLALKSLTQGESPNAVTLQMAEERWDTRPDTDSYGYVNLEFEAGQLNADDLKEDAGFEGSVDLFSHSRSGSGWKSLVERTLTEYCGTCWEMNSRQYEAETGLFHWEYVFQITDEEAGDADAIISQN